MGTLIMVSYVGLTSSSSIMDAGRANWIVGLVGESMQLTSSPLPLPVL